MATQEGPCMKRVRVTDRSAEHRQRRAKSFRQAATALACVAIVLVGTQGGMLYDRSPISENVSLLSATAVPLAGLVVAVGLLMWSLTSTYAAVLRKDVTTFVSVWAALLVLWTGFRVFGAPDHLLSVVLFGIVALSVSLAVLIAVSYRSPKVLTAVVLSLVMAGLLLSVVGLREYLAEWRGGNPSWRVFAGFAVPNFLAGFFVAVIPLTLALLLGVKDRLSTLVLGFILVLQVLTMLLTQSRLGVMALLAGGLVFIALAWLRGLLKGLVGRRVLVIALALAVVGVIGARPVIQRLRASRDQSYSARFRVMTWRGAMRMVATHPLSGTGTGSFDSVYPRYAIVGYTQHAHNSFLQWACDNGLPGLFLLVGVLVLSLAGAVRASGGPSPPEWLLGEERLVATGIVAGLVGVIVHNVFDSDLYVPANTVAMAVLCGLAAALAARQAAQVSAGRARHGRQLPWWLWATPITILAVAGLIGGTRLLLARVHTVMATRAMATRDVIGALESFRAAAAASPWDPEPHLAIAALHDRLNESDAALAALRRAVAIAPSGKTYYRLGRYLISMGRPAEAVAELEKALRHDPRHLRTMLALADAYRATGRTEDAEKTYRTMITLHKSPVGQVRAIPEVVDWEYGFAYAGLAERDLSREDSEEALLHLKEAETILATLWKTRNDVMVRLRVSAETLREAAARYEWVLSQQVELLRRLGRDQDADEASQRLAAFRDELRKETGGPGTD